MEQRAIEDTRTAGSRGTNTAMEPGATKVPTPEAGTDSVYIVWPGGNRSRHLYYWLRENCHCPKCTHPAAWERTVDFLAIPLDIAPASLSADARGLRIEWPDHDAPCDGSFFSWAWLDAHRMERGARLRRKQQPRSWSATDFSKRAVSVDFADVMTSDAGLLELLEHVDDKGVALVKGMPSHDDDVLALAERIALVEGSHFGRHFTVESKPDAENLAYTPRQLYPHNDLPSRRYPPGIQFLHCLRNDATGGDSVLVDGIACAEALRQLDRGAFELLSTREISFTSTADDWHIVNRATVIDVDEDGAIVGTRLHPALIGPVDIEPESQMAFYRAHRRFLSIASSEEMQFRFRLNAGECQVFDNHRIMHARLGFDPKSGRRLLQGCYICRDDFHSRLELLRRRGRDFRDT